MPTEEKTNLPCDGEFRLMEVPPAYVGKLAIIEKYLIKMTSADQTKIAKDILEIMKNPKNCPYVGKQYSQIISITGNVSGLKVKRYQYELGNCDWLQLIMRRGIAAMKRYDKKEGMLIIEFQEEIMGNGRIYNDFAGVSASQNLISTDDINTHLGLCTKQTRLQTKQMDWSKNLDDHDTHLDLHTKQIDWGEENYLSTIAG
jgi:hypothetical protein